MDVERTAKVKLAVPDDRRDDLRRTMYAFREAAQRFADRGWDGGENGYVITSRSRLQSLVYNEIREETGLKADLCIGAVNHAVDALRSCVEKMKAGEKTSCPEFTSTTTVYNTNAVSYFDGHCTLAAYGDGRIRAEYIYSDDSPQARYMENDQWRKQGAKLVYDNQSDTYYLHVTVVTDQEMRHEQTGNRTVLGVDLNVDGHTAVTSNGQFIGNADYLSHKRREYEKRRGKLQQTGTESAHRTIRSIGDRFAKWSEDYLHQVSKQIVEEAVDHGCQVIVFENLEQIRDRISNGKKFQQWAFNELQRQVEYKAAGQGIHVEKVSPSYTSQQCSHRDCGFTHDRNRDGDRFHCQNCGKQLHADYNAARNIAHKFLQNRLKSGSGRATYHLALKSGTMNGNGEHSPAAV